MAAEPDWLKTARAKGLVTGEGPPAPRTAPAKSVARTVPLSWCLVVELPLPITGQGQNAREHWAVRAKRTRRERAGVATMLASLVGRVPCPSVVRLTILGGHRRIDDDNVKGRLKAARDGVADFLAVDDGDERIRWEYGHERGRELGVRVELSGGRSE